MPLERTAPALMRRRFAACRLSGPFSLQPNRATARSLFVCGVRRMSDWIYESCDPVLEDRPSLPRKVFVRAVPSLAAFSFSAAVALRLAGGLASRRSRRIRNSRAPRAIRPSRCPMSIWPPASRSPISKSRAIPSAACSTPTSTSGMPAMQAARTDPIGPSFSPLQAQPLFAQIETPESGPQIAEDDANQPAARAGGSGGLAEDVDPAPLNPALPPVETADADQALPARAPPRPPPKAGAPLPPARPSELAALARAAQEQAPHRANSLLRPSNPPGRPAPPPPPRVNAPRPRPWPATTRAASSTRSSTTMISSRKVRNSPMRRRTAAAACSALATPSRPRRRRSRRRRHGGL